LTQGMYIYGKKSKTVDVLPAGNIRCDIIRARKKGANNVSLKTQTH